MPERRAVPILLTTPGGTVTAANPAAEALLGRCSSLSCNSLLRAEGPDFSKVCRPGCAHTFEPHEQRDHGVVRIRGEGWRLLCSAVDGVRVLTLLPAASPEGDELLSPREKQVLELVARGLTTGRIARRLGLGTSTVRTHVEHIRDKLGVRSRSQAVARALATGQIGQ